MQRESAQPRVSGEEDVCSGLRGPVLGKGLVNTIGGKGLLLLFFKLTSALVVFKNLERLSYWIILLLFVYDVHAIIIINNGKFKSFVFILSLYSNMSEKTTKNLEVFKCLKKV